MLCNVLLRHKCIYVCAELFCFTRIIRYLLCFYWKSSLASPRIDHLERWTTDHLASPTTWCVSTEENARCYPHHRASPRITSHHLEFLSFSRNTLNDSSVSTHRVAGSNPWPVVPPSPQCWWSWFSARPSRSSDGGSPPPDSWSSSAACRCWCTSTGSPSCSCHS